VTARSPTWPIKQHATGPSLRVQIRDETTGLPVDLTGASAVAHLYDASGGAALWTGHAVVVEDPAEGILRLDWASGDLDTAGTHPLEFEVTLASGEIETYPQDGYIYLQIRQDLNGA